MNSMFIYADRLRRQRREKWLLFPSLSWESRQFCAGSNATEFKLLMHFSFVEAQTRSLFTFPNVWERGMYEHAENSFTRP